MKIDSYSFGSITIDGKSYQNDLIIFPDKIHQDWWREKGHSLSIEDLQEVIYYKPDVLIVGTGASGVMEIPMNTRQKLKEYGIELINANTHDAYKIFNEYVTKKDIKLAGAFHLTC